MATGTYETVLVRKGERITPVTPNHPEKRNAMNPRHCFDHEAVRIKWLARWRRTGSVAAKRMGGYKRLPLDGHVELVLGLIADHREPTVRDGLRQAQDTATKGRRTLCRRPVGTHRHPG